MYCILCFSLLQYLFSFLIKTLEKRRVLRRFSFFEGYSTYFSPLRIISNTVYLKTPTLTLTFFPPDLIVIFVHPGFFA